MQKMLFWCEFKRRRSQQERHPKPLAFDGHFLRLSFSEPVSSCGAGQVVGEVPLSGWVKMLPFGQRCFSEFLVFKLIAKTRNLKTTRVFFCWWRNKVVRLQFSCRQLCFEPAIWFCVVTIAAFFLTDPHGIRILFFALDKTSFSCVSPTSPPAPFVSRPEKNLHQSSAPCWRMLNATARSFRPKHT